MRKILVSLMLIMGITAQAQVYIGSAHGHKHYIYPASIQRDKNYLKVWRETEYFTLQSFRGKEYSFSKEQNLIDCNEMRIGVITGYMYDESGDLVHILNSNDWQAEKNMLSIPPGNSFWYVLDDICNYIK